MSCALISCNSFVSANSAASRACSTQGLFDFFALDSGRDLVRDQRYRVMNRVGIVSRLDELKHADEPALDGQRIGGERPETFLPRPCLILHARITAYVVGQVWRALLRAS